nr:glycosyltransferase [Marinobacter panjinensis]
MKLIFRFPLIVDRHTNFRLGKGISLNPAIWFVILCSEFSLKVADLTIVTNEFLKNVVEKKGGRAIVLHDKIPELKQDAQSLELPGKVNILFVCTFSPDEPYLEVIKAAEQLPNDYCVLITGNYEKAGLDPSSDFIANNVRLLGFVSSNAYDAYVQYCDMMMVLTTSEWVLVCGGYEAMAAGKPLITSDTMTLKAFYGQSAEYTSANSKSIAQAAMKVANNPDIYKHLIAQECLEKTKLWRKQWSELDTFLENAEAFSSTTR